MAHLTRPGCPRSSQITVKRPYGASPRPLHCTEVSRERVLWVQRIFKAWKGKYEAISYLQMKRHRGREGYSRSPGKHVPGSTAMRLRTPGAQMPVSRRKEVERDPGSEAGAAVRAPATHGGGDGPRGATLARRGQKAPTRRPRFPIPLARGPDAGEARPGSQAGGWEATRGSPGPMLITRLWSLCRI